VPTEDTTQRPETDEELVSAVEGMTEITPEPMVPDAVTVPEEAGDAAPPEEREEAEAISLMAPDASPEGRVGMTAAEGDVRNLEERLLQEEHEPGAAPGDSIAELTEEEEAEPEVSLEGADEGEESIESIVQDLKRERGQS